MQVLNENRFEEIDEAVHGSAKKAKRPRDSDAGEADKASKKQKAESGKAVKPDAEASDKTEKKKDKKEKKKDAVKADGEKASEKKPAAEREVAGGVKIKDTKVGTGPAAKKGNTVSMRYIGKLQNGKTFDSNTKGKPVCTICVFLPRGLTVFTAVHLPPRQGRGDQR